MIEVPPLHFSAWKPWRHRSLPSQDYEVPAGFGILGLYLLAHWKDAPPSTRPDAAKLPAEVFYIGMSRHIDQRLEQPHGSVERYKREFEDRARAHLYFSTFSSGWSSHSHASTDPVQRAELAFYERGVILRYARTHGRLPLFNRS